MNREAVSPPAADATDAAAHWTVSLYVPHDRFAALIGRGAGQEEMRVFQRRYLGSAALGDAVDPLFNDIADRTRAGGAGECLLDTPGAREAVHIHVPARIAWATEGLRVEAAPPGLGGRRKAQMRRFWYAHRNGAVSYHLALEVPFRHCPGDYYFLSLLQKALAPTEFAPSSLADTGGRTVSAGRTGVPPLDELRLASAGSGRAPFWRFVAERFEADARHLAAHLAGALGSPAPLPERCRFRDLVLHEPFAEAGDLDMPIVRYMVFFRDARLFERLRPPADRAGGAPPPRALLVQQPCYDAYLERFAEEIERARSAGGGSVTLGPAYWRWALTRPEYAGLSDAEVVEYRQEIPTFEKRRPDCLDYLFLSGFNQNIIDFMNQDASEILDSIDPIYPPPGSADEDAFFIRFANRRALISYARGSRSLEAGKPFIGTCPYAFLIHIASLHNEFLAREHEARTHALLTQVRQLNQRRKWRVAAEAFYDFRREMNDRYRAHRHRNLFRYDTERGVFEAIERQRGTLWRDEHLERLVQDLEAETRDMEARVAKNDESWIAWLLGGLGIFGLGQLLFQLADVLRAAAADAAAGRPGPFGDIGNPALLEVAADRLTLATSIFSVTSIACLTAAALVFGGRMLWRKWRP